MKQLCVKCYSIFTLAHGGRSYTGEHVIKNINKIFNLLWLPNNLQTFLESLNLTATVRISRE